MFGKIKTYFFDLKDLSLSPERVDFKGTIKVIYKYKGEIISEDLIKVKNKPPGKIYLRTKFIEKNFLKFLFLFFKKDFDKNICFKERDGKLSSFSQNLFKLKDIYSGEKFIKTTTAITGFKSPQRELSKKEVAEIILEKVKNKNKPNSRNKKALVIFTEKIKRSELKNITENFHKIIVFLLSKKENILTEGKITEIHTKKLKILEIVRALKGIAPSHDFFIIGSKEKFPQIDIHFDEVWKYFKRDDIKLLFPYLSFDTKRSISQIIYEKSKIKKEFYYGSHSVTFEDIAVHSRIVEDFTISRSFAFFIKGESIYNLIPDGKLWEAKKWGNFTEKLSLSIVNLFVKGVKGAYSSRESINFHIKKCTFFPLHILKLIKISLNSVLKNKRAAYFLMLLIGISIDLAKSINLRGNKVRFLENFLKALYLFFLLPFYIFLALKKGKGINKIFSKEVKNQSFNFYEITEEKIESESSGEIANIFYKIKGSPLSFIPITKYGILSSQLLEDELLLFNTTLFLQKIVELILENKLFPEKVKSQDEKFNLNCELIIATRDRVEDLKNLLSSVEKIERDSVKNFKITVVDSCSKEKGIKDICKKFNTNYIRVDVPGKSYALNVAIKNSNADILLFTDDDAVLDKNWLKNTLNSFYSEDVYLTAGIVLPLTIKSFVEHIFEGHHEDFSIGGLRRGFLKREYCYPFNIFKSAVIGTGANMAIRKKAFEDFGKFDPSLSPGTPSKAGEEVDFFFRILKGNKNIIYNPEAIVYHRHRDTYSGLKKTFYNYGVSSGAFYTRWFLKERNICSLCYFLRYNIISLGIKILKNTFFKKEYPPEILLYEFIGCFIGPFAYIYSNIKSIFLYKGLK